MTPLLAQSSSDSFTTFPADFDTPDKHHVPVVPEPRFYGAILLTLCLALIIWRRFRRPRFSMPEATKGLSRKQRLFLKEHDIYISNAYIGMLRAYHQNRTIWQTSAMTPYLMAATRGRPCDLATELLLLDEWNRGQLECWISYLTRLDQTELDKQLSINLGLFQ